jgi:hypothetical protein
MSVTEPKSYADAYVAAYATVRDRIYALTDDELLAQPNYGYWLHGPLVQEDHGWIQLPGAMSEPFLRLEYPGLSNEMTKQLEELYSGRCLLAFDRATPNLKHRLSDLCRKLADHVVANGGEVEHCSNPDWMEVGTKPGDVSWSARTETVSEGWILRVGRSRLIKHGYHQDETADIKRIFLVYDLPYWQMTVSLPHDSDCSSDLRQDFGILRSSVDLMTDVTDALLG